MTNTLCCAIAHRIREVRLARGMTQEALGAASDMQRSYISKVENGHLNIATLTFLRFCLGLNVPPAWLLKGL